MVATIKICEQIFSASKLIDCFLIRTPNKVLAFNFIQGEVFMYIIMRVFLNNGKTYSYDFMLMI